ncbi:hypothetical protein HAX54_007673 [Datura stramonium]|uniref:Uncharacterized protein n=1 Tax=Datura stramonium TaxID=4076 RepID=A0ABS8TDT3_DATST|nr:hypothetical protein [Datura stramonium]
MTLKTPEEKDNINKIIQYQREVRVFIHICTQTFYSFKNHFQYLHSSVKFQSSAPIIQTLRLEDQIN